MKAIRQTRSAVRSSFVVSPSRRNPDSQLPAVPRARLTCRWRRAADGRLSCVWEGVDWPPRRRAPLALVSKGVR